LFESLVCFFAGSSYTSCSKSRRNQPHLPLFLLFFYVILGAAFAHAQVSTVSIRSPKLSNTAITNLLSPIHLQATAEDTARITGYVVYIDDKNVYRNFAPSADAWIMVSPGYHTLYVKAWDAFSHLSTQTYYVNVVGFAPPAPPVRANRILNIDNGAFTVDNHPHVGGSCNHGSLGSFSRNADPNTWNLPSYDGQGQHLILSSGCQYDDSLFYRKYDPTTLNSSGDTNFLWDFWFYIPTTTRSNTVQALEFDLFHAVQMSDGVHEFMFGSQCNYVTNQWQLWLPRGNGLAWVDTGISPCRFVAGEWHHATYYLQRVTPSGYQEIPGTFSPLSDKNTSLRYGTLTIDGQTVYLGGVAWSTIPRPAWSPVLGVQHQLDSAVAGIVIEQFVDGSSLTSW
jgi:hypothetical protein